MLCLFKKSPRNALGKPNEEANFRLPKSVATYIGFGKLLKYTTKKSFL